MKHITRIIGIDPGKTGAMCLQNLVGDMMVQKIAYNAVAIAQQLKKLKAGHNNTLVVVERVAMYRGDSQDNRQYQMKKLWDHHERIMTCLALMGAQVCSITPQSWQRDLRLHRKNEEYGDRKRRLTRTARSLYEFTGQPIMQWGADAILLAHWGRWHLVHNPEKVVNNLKAQEV